MQIEQPTAEWLRNAVARVEELTTLAQGWDGYDAREINAGVAVRTVQWILDHAYPTLPEPAIVPMASGGIQIEWHRGGVDFEVAIDDEESTVYVEDQHSGYVTEGSLREAATIFSSLLERLASA